MAKKSDSRKVGDIVRQRWYDQRPELTECIVLVEAFPEEIYAIICQGAICMVEKEFEAHLMLSSLKSLGSEKILGLYKSKHKRRKMDCEPHFHQLMNYFYILSPQNRLFMAGLIKELVGYIHQYFESCRIYHQPVTREDIIGITRCYVDKGGEEAQAFLESLQLHFQQRIRNALVKTNPDDLRISIQKDDTGLHLRPRQ
ncbi:MAG TPA: hypothetical protein V6C52_00765 [Coleofasciculaceae cyanobacterium]|jgi:hypothetical protein